MEAQKAILLLLRCLLSGVGLWLQPVMSAPVLTTEGPWECKNGSFNCFRDCCKKGEWYCNEKVTERRCEPCERQKDQCWTPHEHKDCQLYCYLLLQTNTKENSRPTSVGTAFFATTATSTSTFYSSFTTPVALEQAAVGLSFETSVAITVSSIVVAIIATCLFLHCVRGSALVRSWRQRTSDRVHRLCRWLRDKPGTGSPQDPNPGSSARNSIAASPPDFDIRDVNREPLLTPASNQTAGQVKENVSLNDGDLNGSTNHGCNQEAEGCPMLRATRETERLPLVNASQVDRDVHYGREVPGEGDSADSHDDGELQENQLSGYVNGMNEAGDNSFPSSSASNGINSSRPPDRSQRHPHEASRDVHMQKSTAAIEPAQGDQENQPGHQNQDGGVTSLQQKGHGHTTVNQSFSANININGCPVHPLHVERNTSPLMDDTRSSTNPGVAYQPTDYVVSNRTGRGQFDDGSISSRHPDDQPAHAHKPDDHNVHVANGNNNVDPSQGNETKMFRDQRLYTCPSQDDNGEQVVVVPGCTDPTKGYLPLTTS